MTPLVLVLTAAAGGVGGALRFLLDHAVRRRVGGPFPLGIVVVNVTGSLALGLLVGAAAGVEGFGDVLTIVGTGLLGGYTTFSTASVDTVRLLHVRRYGLAALQALGTFIVCVAVAALGIWLGGLLT